MRKFWLFWGPFWIVYGVAYTLWMIAVHQYWFSLVGVFIIGVNVTTTILNIRSYREHRRSYRNRGSAGTSQGTSYSGYLTTYASSTSTYYSFGASGAGAVGARLDIGSDVDLRTVKGDEPLKAWKWAVVDRSIYPTHEGKVIFRPINSSFPTYGVEDKALCAHGLDDAVKDARWHGSAPSTECRCGFYGMKHRMSTTDPYEMYIPYESWPYIGVLLEVEFYGRVIRCTNGYRAEKIRVLCIHGRKEEERRAGQPTIGCETEWRWDLG